LIIYWFHDVCNRTYCHCIPYYNRVFTSRFHDLSMHGHGIKRRFPSRRVRIRRGVWGGGRISCLSHAARGVYSHTHLESVSCRQFALVGATFDGANGPRKGMEGQKTPSFSGRGSGPARERFAYSSFLFALFPLIFSSTCYSQVRPGLTADGFKVALETGGRTVSFKYIFYVCLNFSTSILGLTCSKLAV
jgi:hypothetical protein